VEDQDLICANSNRMPVPAHAFSSQLSGADKIICHRDVIETDQGDPLAHASQIAAQRAYRQQVVDDNERWVEAKAGEVLGCLVSILDGGSAFRNQISSIEIFAAVRLR
jgi:hypothetical protein